MVIEYDPEREAVAAMKLTAETDRVARGRRRDWALAPHVGDNKLNEVTLGNV
jgi:hypothetical protein